MKKLITILIAAVAGSTALSQQEYTYTFFGDNIAFYNPAAVGSNDYSSVTGTFRKQWVGFDGSPTSGGVTFDMPLEKFNMGIGGMVYQDHVGVTNQTNVGAMYSYHIKINENHKLAFGVNAGFDLVNTKFDRLVYWDEDDELLANDYVNVFVPHFGFGAFYHTERLHVGISIPRMISMNTDQFNTVNFENAPSLVTHYYLSAAYDFDLKNEFSLKPSVLVKYTNNVLPQGDVSLICYYKDMIGLGAAYKSLGFASTFLQYNYKDAVIVGYAFDFSLNPLQQYSKGSHEVMVQYRFNTPEKKFKDKPSLN
ncbi:MAG: type IX secretion system membrane protein PorP/SprF [Crocinitomicaceae bacterium]|nr:type IX secretion system membrane protein PorP/SprF [Crocinitomicaceae bacterium]